MFYMGLNFLALNLVQDTINFCNKLWIILESGNKKDQIHNFGTYCLYTKGQREQLAKVPVQFFSCFIISIKNS